MTKRTQSPMKLRVFCVHLSLLFAQHSKGVGEMLSNDFLTGVFSTSLGVVRGRGAGTAPFDSRLCFLLALLGTYCLSFTVYRQNAVLLNCHKVRRSASSLSLFVTNGGSRIYRERFDLESPNFTGTFKPVVSTTRPDMTSLTTSGW